MKSGELVEKSTTKKLGIKGVVKTSLIDYPGKVASILFFGGCNFLCPYCHNPELVLKHSEFQNIPPDEILEFLYERKAWLDGVCISGGEPTLFNELPLFCECIKKIGLLVKLDTNGYRSDMIEQLIRDNLVDYISMDIKHTPEKYYTAIGYEEEEAKPFIEQIKTAVSIIRNGSVDYEFRTTVVPGIHSDEDIMNIATWLKGSSRYCLQQFRPGKTLHSDLQEIETFSRQELLDLCDKLEDYFSVCDVRLNMP